MAVSKTQIDRLGDRLKEGSHTEIDLRLLDDYRRSFGAAYELVVRTIRQRGAFPTGRLAKSTVSIVEKLRREKIRLSQMQDIAGCRVVVTNVLEQDRFVLTLKADFPEATVIDRRENPSHGYRAVHIITEVSGKPIEIQVRSSLQHLWAELSEKSSDVLDPTIKYGGGTDEWRNVLTKSSVAVAANEACETMCSKLVAAHETHVTAFEKYEQAAAELINLHVPDHELQELRRQMEDSKLVVADGMTYKEYEQFIAELINLKVSDHEVQKLRREMEDSKREIVRDEQEIQETRGELVNRRNEIAEVLNEMISGLE